MSDAAVQRFDIGRVINQITGLIGRNFISFTVLALLFSGLPYVISMLLQPLLIQPDSQAATILSAALLSIFLTVVPGFLLIGALTRASIDDLGRKGVSVPAALQAGLRYLLPLIGLGLIVGLGVFAAMILLIVPGIILGICWIVSSPVLVVEKAGIFQALQRSLALTRGHRWAIFGLMLLYMLVVVIVAIIIFTIFSGSIVPPQPGELAAQPGIATILFLALIQSFEVLISTVGIAAIYFELRRIKEGIDVSELASVFD